MHRFRPSPALLVAILALIMATTGTALAASSVILQGSNGYKVSATRYGQLLSSQAQTRDHWVSYYYVEPGYCSPVAVIPKGDALVITDVAFVGTTTTSSGQLALYTNLACTDYLGLGIYVVPPASNVSMSLGPGAIFSGTLYGTGINANGEVIISGYTIPKADVSQPSMRRLTITHVPRGSNPLVARQPLKRG